MFGYNMSSQLFVFSKLSSTRFALKIFLFQMHQLDVRSQVSALSKGLAADLTDVVPDVEVHHLDVLLHVGDVCEAFATIWALDVPVPILVQLVPVFQVVSF